MKCWWFETEPYESCDNEATHVNDCAIDAPVCSEHACRHAITFAEAEKRAEARNIPSHWMAL